MYYDSCYLKHDESAFEHQTAFNDTAVNYTLIFLTLPGLTCVLYNHINPLAPDFFFYFSTPCI